MAARFLLAIALLSSSLWVLIPGTAHACSCGSHDAADAIQRYDVIVVGKVVAISSGVRILTYQSEGVRDETRVQDIPVYDFAIDEYLKGTGKSLLEVRDTSGQCGYPISETGGQHLFFLEREANGSLRIPGCSALPFTETFSPVSQINQIRAEVALQGQDDISSSASDALPVWATAAGFGAAVLLGAGLLLGVRRLRSG